MFFDSGFQGCESPGGQLCNLTPSCLNLPGCQVEVDAKSFVNVRRTSLAMARRKVFVLEMVPVQVHFFFIFWRALYDGALIILIVIVIVRYDVGFRVVE